MTMQYTPPATDPAYRVMFVDDDPTLRELMSMFARRLGASTLEAASAEETLEYFSTLPRGAEAPSLMVVDVDLLGMDGVELCEELSERSLFPMDHVVVVSGTASPKDLRRIRALGARRFLRKPFLLEDLEEALRLEEARP